MTALDTVSQSLEAILFGEEYVLSIRLRKGKLYSTADDGGLCELFPLSDREFHYREPGVHQVCFPQE